MYNKIFFFIYNRAFAHFIILLFFFNEIRPMVGISLLRVCCYKKRWEDVFDNSRILCLFALPFVCFFFKFLFFHSNNRDRQLIAVKNDIYPAWIRYDIFLTNVPKCLQSAKLFAGVWRIGIIIVAWNILRNAFSSISIRSGNIVLKVFFDYFKILRTRWSKEWLNRKSRDLIG